jgi:hypothetical protein
MIGVMFGLVHTEYALDVLPELAAYEGFYACSMSTRDPCFRG